jgi:23S rRNA (guanosine2251-2'-O)-methyltransferase
VAGIRFGTLPRTSEKIAEANFLPKIVTGDRPPDGPWIPCLRYRVAIDHMRSAFNVGSIIRVVDAVGFESIMLSSWTPGKENGQVRKTAMGCTEWIPQARHQDLGEALIRAKDEGYSVIGIETVSDSFGYAEYPWPDKGVIVLGNEEYGLTEDVLKACDDFVHLPMSGFKNSVNVANAFAVVAFHISSLHNLK